MLELARLPRLLTFSLLQQNKQSGGNLTVQDSTFKDNFIFVPYQSTVLLAAPALIDVSETTPPQSVAFSFLWCL